MECQSFLSGTGSDWVVFGLEWHRVVHGFSWVLGLMSSTQSAGGILRDMVLCCIDNRSNKDFRRDGSKFFSQVCIITLATTAVVTIDDRF